MPLSASTRAVVAAALASLGCGTIYVYSVYSTQLAARVHLSASQSAVIGMMGTIGVSLFGGFGAATIDWFGPRIPTAVGSVLLLLGYSILYHCYQAQLASMLLLAFGTCIAGLGSALAYSASMKTSAVNFPHARGTATAFPIATFGLSAFFFSTISSIFFKQDTAGFLMLLGIMTAGLCITGAPFLVMPDNHHHHHHQDTKSKAVGSHGTTTPNHSGYGVIHSSQTSLNTMDNNTNHATSNTPTLNEPHQNPFLDDSHAVHGLNLFTRPEFWAQFVVLGLLAGSGQMYIYSVGYIVRAIAQQHSPTTPLLDHTIQSIQSLQVAAISLCSFGGRIISGILSDVLNHRMQRLWMIFLSCMVAIVVHSFMAFTTFTSTFYLWILSCLVGLYYGLAFGVFPTIVGDTFGMRGYSQNWGMVCVAPVFGVYFFNSIFGHVYDANSVKADDPEHEGMVLHVCFKGSGCYSSAFRYSASISVVLLGVVAWMIWTMKHQHPHQMIRKVENQYVRIEEGGHDGNNVDSEVVISQEDEEEVEAMARSAIIP